MALTDRRGSHAGRAERRSSAASCRLFVVGLSQAWPPTRWAHRRGARTISIRRFGPATPRLTGNGGPLAEISDDRLKSTPCPWPMLGGDLVRATVVVTERPDLRGRNRDRRRRKSPCNPSTYWLACLARRGCQGIRGVRSESSEDVAREDRTDAAGGNRDRRRFVRRGVACNAGGGRFPAVLIVVAGDDLDGDCAGVG